MKRSLYILLLSAFFCSCGSKTKPINKDTIAVSTAGNPDSVQLLAKRFAPFIDGYWIKKAYIESIAKTKSPRASSAEAYGIVALNIDTHNAKGDSVVAGVGWNNHEGGELIVKFKTGQNPTSLKTTLITVEDRPGDFYELGYKINRADTNLVVSHSNKNKKLIDAALYIKDLPQTSKSNGLSDAGYRRVNKLLVTGTYLVKDSTGRETKVTLDNEGNMSGLYNYKAYAVNIDFAEGYQQNLDEIWFGSDNNNKKSYAFKIDADTLKLFDTSFSADSAELTLAKLRYKFIKQP